MEKFGVEDQTLTSGRLQGCRLVRLRPMKPDERAQLQSVIDDMYARFVEVVRSGPSGARPRAHRRARRRAHLQRAARQSQTVSWIGSATSRTRSRRAQRRAGLANARVVIYHRPREYRENLYTQARRAAPRGAARALASLPLARPGFLYLWAPGAP